MPVLLPPLRLTGARILRDGQLQARSVAFAAGRITTGPLPEVDLSGFLVLPGMVDAHAPPNPMYPGLIKAQTIAAQAGVTTTIAVRGWGWRGGPKAADMAETAMRDLARLRPRLATDTRLHLRAEVTAVRDEGRLLAAVTSGLAQGVIFADTADLVADDLPADLAAARQLALRERPNVPRHLCRLAETFDALSLPYGSISDPDGETRERNSMIGARIAVFPATRRAAVAAHAMMSPVILSALSLMAGDAVVDGLIGSGICDALASDGQPMSLAAAAFGLSERLGWARSWGLVSEGPAEILRLTDRGRIAPGLRADLAVVAPETGEVQATICRGRLTHLTAEAAERFRAQPAALPFLKQAAVLPVAAE